MSQTPPPAKHRIVWSNHATIAVAWETAFKRVLIPKQSELEARSGRIIQNAQRTFGYDKDDLAGTFLNELTAYLASRKPIGLPKNYHYRLYDPALEEMELSYWNGAEQGAMSVLNPEIYGDHQSPEKRFLTYYWKDKEIPFKEILEGLENTQGSPLFNEETIRGAVNILYHYCQEQFVRGFSQGEREATSSPEKLRRLVANLIPDRTPG